jgi:SAM-dependent methyltransferase
MAGEVAARANASAFDDYVDNYDAACERGLQYAGESRDYFAKERVEFTRQRAGERFDGCMILDFGCGPGHTTPHLLEAFPGASVVGLDDSAEMIASATKRFGGRQARFVSEFQEVAKAQFDLIYCNGVFHHIPPPERRAVMHELMERLRPGGLLALWENNPWNPGTRFVMSRIPFDRDAITLTYRESQRLLRSASFQLIGTTFHFYFPKALKALRSFEPMLRQLPLGAQYCVLGKRVS